jgi:hypothetical protein
MVKVSACFGIIDSLVLLEEMWGATLKAHAYPQVSRVILANFPGRAFTGTQKRAQRTASTIWSLLDQK